MTRHSRARTRGRTEPNRSTLPRLSLDDARAQLPESFRDELRPHFDAAYPVLSELAERHAAKAIVPVSLASVLLGHSRKPLVRSAFEFAAWADGKAQPRKDVLAGYRNWLEKTDDLATFEQLGVDGLPAGVVAGARSGQKASVARRNALMGIG